MKIATTIEHFVKRFGENETFGRLSEIGYDGVDYFHWEGYNVPNEIFSKGRDAWTAKYRSVAQMAKQNGISIFQAHATFPTDIYVKGRMTEATLDHFKKEIEATAILGCPYIVIHPINIAIYEKDRERDFEANMESFSLLEPTLREFDVKLGVENMFGWDDLRRRNCPTGCSLPEDMIKYIDTMKSDRFVACLDTGHMLINCVSPAEAVRKLGSRLKLMHVHDNNAIIDSHAAPTMGVCDWNAFVAALREVGYDGVFSMEINYENVLKNSETLGWEYAAYAYKAAKSILESK